MPRVEIELKIQRLEKRIRKTRIEIEELRSREYEDVLKWSYLHSLRRDRREAKARE